MKPHQEGDPAALSRPCLSGRRHLRHRGGGGFLFRQVDQGRQPRRGGDGSAGLFKAPGHLAPHINLPAARGRANVVLSNMVESGFATEGQGAACPAQPGHGGGPRQPRQPPTTSSTGLLNRSRWSPRATGRPRLWRARPSISTSSAPPRNRSNIICASMAATMARPKVPSWCWRTTARCGRSSAGAIMRAASSTAPRGRCARPARRSRPMSTPPPWRPVSRLSRSSRMRRSPGPAGRRRTTRAAFPATSP